MKYEAYSVVQQDGFAHFITIMTSHIFLAYSSAQVHTSFKSFQKLFNMLA